MQTKLAVEQATVAGRFDVDVVRALVALLRALHACPTVIASKTALHDPETALITTAEYRVMHARLQRALSQQLRGLVVDGSVEYTYM